MFSRGISLFKISPRYVLAGNLAPIPPLRLYKNVPICARKHCPIGLTLTKYVISGT